ncbi:ABC transporter permease [Romboutsia weinsteinii]|uniref:Nickel import system permease protein NikB n=1 Tax=Romboutsia weinsteinii TaxID=2020949 RepID=A0A371J649_9FIRM|nr:nickel ABC transporter permease [Romboutsia weinsteinii]RDY28239.1 ABC transporter permease [Romboutsia weinsteinii]
MFRYIRNRLLMLIPVILGVTFLVFYIMSFSPGDPAAIILGDNASAESIAQLQEELGLNEPVIVQYAKYMKKCVTGDLGESYATGRDVFEEVMSRLPNTFALTFWAMIVAIIVSIPVGIISATKQYSLVDSISMIAALIGVSMPNFWFGLLMIMLFSLNLGWLPSGGASSYISLIMPAITIGVSCAANITRTTRSSMLDVIRQDYIRTAKAKGVNKKKVVRKHALRNALIPVITVIGLQFGNLLGGAVLTETVFSWPGVGRLIVDAIKAKDTPMVLGCLIVFAVCFSLVNLLVDILYGYIDPRIKAKYE